MTTQIVNQASTRVTVTPSPSASVLGQSVTLNASVTAVPPGGGVPTGSLAFFDGTTPLGTATLNAGTASISTSALALGSHFITAVYTSDDTSFLGSTSSPTLELVGGTMVTLVTSANPSAYGESVNFTATVAAVAAGGSVPTGSVTFMDGTQSLGMRTLSASGVASISIANLSGGTHAISAAYGGDADSAASTSSVTGQVVTPVSTNTTLHESAGEASFGQSVTFTATVSAAVGSPTGSVTFMDGSTVLGTIPVNASGVATFSSSSLAVGSHSLAANFSGSNSYNSSASSKLALTVDQTATMTMLAGSTPTPGVGQVVTFTATVSTVASGGWLAHGRGRFPRRFQRDRDGSGLRRTGLAPGRTDRSRNGARDRGQLCRQLRLLCERVGGPSGDRCAGNAHRDAGGNSGLRGFKSPGSDLSGGGAGGTRGQPGAGRIRHL